MDWLASNWIWIVFAVAFLALHMFGHGGHGRQRRDPQRSRGGAEEPAPATATPHAAHGDRTPTQERQRRRHGC